MPTSKQLWNKLSFPLQISFNTLAKRILRNYLYVYHVNLISGTISIEDYVMFGYNVSVITGTHDMQKIGIERTKAFPKSGRDITIKRGAWIASNVTILGPCTIGENAVVGACCLVRHDIPANTVCYSNNKVILKPLSLPVDQKKLPS